MAFNFFRLSPPQAAGYYAEKFALQTAESLLKTDAPQAAGNITQKNYSKVYFFIVP